MNLSRRSYQQELLDFDAISFTEIERNMYELDIINSRLGGHSITLAGFISLLPETLPPRPILVCEIGCGGGDNLLAIRTYCSGKGIAVSFIGIDYNPHCIAIAASRFREEEAAWITSDYKISLPGEQKPDIIFSSLFCHHFREQELVSMFKWMQEHAQRGFFINDLHRHILAYYSILALTALLSKSRLVRHDAPLSVRRGFRRKEWELLLAAADISEYALSWKWAFRWLIVCRSPRISESFN